MYIVKWQAGMWKVLNILEVELGVESFIVICDPDI
jgi:hypothetical protein